MGLGIFKEIDQNNKIKIHKEIINKHIKLKEDSDLESESNNGIENFIKEFIIKD